MKSAMPGRTTSEIEVTNISEHGFWLFFDGSERFLSYEHFPWFKNATVAQICDIDRLSQRHIYWPELDIDLAVESIDHPERFPLVSKAGRPAGV